MSKKKRRSQQLLGNSVQWPTNGGLAASPRVGSSTHQDYYYYYYYYYYLPPHGRGGTC